ncbi:MAG: efflux RND transporter periplasmic adaptor subunit [Motiliproteus sp.]
MNSFANFTKYVKPTALVLAFYGYSAAAVATEARELDCVIEPSEIADVSSSVRGIMEKVLVKRGDWVEKGQIIAKLESSVERASVALAQAEAEANSLIRARSARLTLAEKRVRRVLELKKSQAIASQALDEAETDMVLAQADLEQVRHDQHLAALRLARARSMLALRSIKSPVTGTVQTVHISAGESVEDRPIMTIVQIDPLYVEVIVPVKMFGQIKQGDPSHVYPEEPLGGDFLASVVMVERIIDAPSGTFGVRLALSNAENKLPAGLRCKVAFD